MITTSHLLLNLAVLDKSRPAYPISLAASLAIAIGAVLPDAAMFLFYAAEKFRGVPEAAIWSESYYQPGWQVVFDTFNSLPIIAAVALVGWLRNSWVIMLLCASMALHIALDLPLHHDDGHRHFWPLSDWRFASPISYWDHRHYGNIAQPIEQFVALCCGLILLRRYPSWPARIAVGLIMLSYLAFAGYALVFWRG